jgi:hypothetical protein
MLKRTIPMLIASLGGIVLIVAFFFPSMQEVSNEVSVWFNILAAVAFVLGGGNLIKLNLKRISDRQPGWGFAAVTLGSFVITLAVGLLKSHVQPDPEHLDMAWSGDFVGEGGWFWWIYTYMFAPLSSTMFALLAFFVASAAFRAFRAKNAEATMLLATAFIVLLGQTYAGYWLTSWIPEDKYPALTIPGVTQIIQDVFTAAGQRAIMIGIALGIVATALKIILGLDRSYIGSEE